MTRYWATVAFVLALGGCAKSDMERCVDARVAAFDENHPDGVTKAGKTRIEFRADTEAFCLAVASGR